MMCITALFMQAQPSGLELYQFPKQVPLNYQLNASVELAKLTYPENSGLSKKDFNVFTNDIVNNKISQINKGEIYFDWVEAELYLKRFLNKLLPDSLKAAKNLGIYLRRDPTPNAYSSYDASIYINVGLLADIESEAALAFVLSHELAHYLGNHQLLNYHQLSKKIKNADGKPEKSTHANKLLELNADEVAAKIIQQAGFDIKCAHSVFDMLYQSDDLFKKQRIENLDKLFNSSPADTSKIENGSLFKKINQLAKYEKLQLLLDKILYRDCLINAINYYLNDNDLDFMPYYIVEAARRYVLLHPDQVNNSFLHKKTTGLTSSSNQIKDSDYNSIIEHFLTPFHIENIPELEFSKALYYYQKLDTAKARPVLNNYIEQQDSKYKNLAKYLAGVPLPDQFGYKESQVIVDNLEAYMVYQGKSKNKSAINIAATNQLNEKFTLKLKQYLKSKFPDKEVILLEDLCKNNFKKSIAYRNIPLATLLVKKVGHLNSLSNEKLLFLLKPESFNLFFEEKVNNITFLNIDAFENSLRQKNGARLNPFNWVADLFSAYRVGSSRHFYRIEQININKSSGIVFHNTDTTKYKLTLPHLLNSVYSTLRLSNTGNEDFTEN